MDAQLNLKIKIVVVITVIGICISAITDRDRAWAIHTPQKIVHGIWFFLAEIRDTFSHKILSIKIFVQNLDTENLNLAY